MLKRLENNWLIVKIVDATHISAIYGFFLAVCIAVAATTVIAVISGVISFMVSGSFTQIFEIGMIISEGILALFLVAILIDLWISGFREWRAKP